MIDDGHYNHNIKMITFFINQLVKYYMNVVVI